MTDEELKQLVANLAISQQKTDAQFKKLGKLIGNIGNNQGDIVEEFLYRSFKRNPVLNNIHFDNVTRHLKNCVTGIEIVNNGRLLH